MTPGQKLIALDPCEMEDDGRETLTVGKEYEVVSWDKEEIKVIDDEGCEHSFQHSEVNDFFRVAPSFGQWLPIDSAPKDGNSFLVRNGSDVAVGSHDHYGRITPDGVYSDYDGRGTVLFEFTPIEWMPLPELPKE